MPSGYMVKIEDGQGNTKKFYSRKAKSHGQGNSLASGLIASFSRRFPQFGRFSTRSVEPSNGTEDSQDVDGDRYDDLNWP
jgi:hypothetical protein